MGQDIFCHPIKFNLILVFESFKPTYNESRKVTLNFQDKSKRHPCHLHVPGEMVKFNHQAKSLN